MEAPKNRESEIDEFFQEYPYLEYLSDYVISFIQHKRTDMQKLCVEWMPLDKVIDKLWDAKKWVIINKSFTLLENKYELVVYQNNIEYALEYLFKTFLATMFHYPFSYKHLLQWTII